MRSLLLLYLVQSYAFLRQPGRIAHFRPSIILKDSTSIGSKAEALTDALTKAQVSKACKVKIGPSDNDSMRIGMIATENIRKGDVVLALPYDDQYTLTAESARTTVFQDVLAEDYDGWTGDAGLIALLILNELARAENNGSEGGGTDQPSRPAPIQAWMASWVAALPGLDELDGSHPLLWSEDDQEVLQKSTTSKIYRKLDDLEEDVSWLETNVFEKDRSRFPETVSWNGSTTPCFSLMGFTWAMALVQSRAIFVDGELQLIPTMDMFNHDDEAGNEIESGFMGTFGTTKGCKLVAGTNYKAGEEVFCSYGPKSAADYLLEHGFCPEQCWKTAVSELTFELQSDDRFYDDKLDILEFETYDQAPMDPSQSFDVISAPGRDGEPDPAMVQFVRLCKLGSTDAFLLESIFRKEVWGFMAYPVSERNERDMVDTVIETCQKALDDFADCPDGGPAVCQQLRESETRALTRTRDFLKRDREALDLKEYYQERRLKDLGLDSEWSPEDDMSPDLGFGQTRAPGGADYDW